MHRATIILLAVVAAALPVASAAAAARPDDARSDDARADPMRKLDWLVGTWEGEGWIIAGPAGRTTFHGTEHVRPMIGGEALLIEGRHSNTVDRDTVVHDAAAVVSWAAEKNEYRFQTYRAGRGAQEASARFAGDDLRWGFTDDVSGVAVRFTISRDAQGRWVEVGDASRDGGGRWNRFFEMTMTRADENKTPAPADVAADHDDIAQRRASTWICFLHPVRDGFVEQPTEKEQRLVGAHFRRLVAATEDGRVLLAGPSTDPPYTGVIVFRADDRAAARTFIDADPAVIGGIFEARLSPLILSLFAGAP